MHSEAGMARRGKFKRHDGSEANAIAAKTSVKASLPSLHDKWYLFLTLRSRSDLRDELLYSTFVIAIINVTFYYSATPANMYSSSARRAVCLIYGILALYSSETISEGLKSKLFLGDMPPDPPCGRAMHTFTCSA